MLVYIGIVKYIMMMSEILLMMSGDIVKPYDLFIAAPEVMLRKLESSPAEDNAQITMLPLPAFNTMACYYSSSTRKIVLCQAYSKSTLNLPGSISCRQPRHFYSYSTIRFVQSLYQDNYELVCAHVCTGVGNITGVR